MSVSDHTNANSYQAERFVNASDYTLRYVVDHLISSGHFEELHKIICPHFMWAKRNRYGSHQGLVQDLTQTIESLQHEGLNGLPHLIFYSVLYSTLRSMANNISPETLRIVAQLGQKERAISYAETISDRHQRALAFQLIGGGGKRAQEQEKDEGVERKLDGALIQRAFSESLLIESDYERVEFLSRLAPDLARVGDKEGGL